MSDLDIGLLIAGWLLSGLIPQLHDLRYNVKEIRVKDIWFTLIVMVFGPLFALFCLFLWVDGDKVLKSWK